ncbi:MAG: hypothetical protein KF817_15925 [Phycisphaeraceae bacterium]|nr:hypothetical protein [Phycisphaeraceae bacterium]
MRTTTATIGATAIAMPAVFVMTAQSPAALIHYSQLARDAWFGDAGAIETIRTITFTEHPMGQLTTQYQESHGMTVTGSGWVQIMAADSGFPLDGRGMGTLSSDAIFHYDRPMQALAMDFPGNITVQFLIDMELIGVATVGASGAGNFRGIISTLPFNRVRMHDSDGVFGIADLHFVPVAVPAPAGALVLLPAALMLTRRRRRQCGAGDLRRCSHEGPASAPSPPRGAPMCAGAQRGWRGRVGVIRVIGVLGVLLGSVLPHPADRSASAAPGWRTGQDQISIPVLAPSSSPHGADGARNASVHVSIAVSVHTADGSPVEDAVVFTDHGGPTATDANGRAVVRVALLRGVDAVSLSAASSSHGMNLPGTRRLTLREGWSVEHDPTTITDAGIITVRAGGACEPTWLPGFWLPGMNPAVSALTVFDDGSGPALHVSGEFATAGGLVSVRFAKWQGCHASNPCQADFDGDGIVGMSDLSAILAAWGVCSGCDQDLTGDGVVDFRDVLALLASWGRCP